VFSPDLVGVVIHSFGTELFPYYPQAMNSLRFAMALAVFATRTASLEADEHAKAVESRMQDSRAHVPMKKTLLQVGAKHRSKSTWGNPMFNPEYFGLFAQEESTASYDGTLAGRTINPELNVLDGWNPHEKNPLKPEATSPEFFHESPSGAYLQAWQSNFPSLGAADANLNPSPFKAFFPALTASLEAGTTETGPWFTGAGGYWQQTYMPEAQVVAGSPDASWFDSSVRQIDGYGREKFPGYESPRNDLFWEQRSVNTTLTCKEAGCVANVSLAAPFDMANEEAAHCFMSVYFHPTVLMEKHGEFVQWVQVNNQLVQSSCRPQAAGCNSSAQRPLLPCVYNLPLGKLMQSSGSVLTVAAKIVNSSSQCPYNGDHLSAVPMVTCLVGKKFVGEPEDLAMMQDARTEKQPMGPNMLQRIMQREAKHGTSGTPAMSPERNDDHKLFGRLRTLLKNRRDKVRP